QPFDDVPGVVVVGERIVAQRSNLRIGDDRRRKRGDRLLRAGGGRGEQKRGKEIRLFHGGMPRAGERTKSRPAVDKICAAVDQSSRICLPSGGWKRSVRSANLAWRRPYFFAAISKRVFSRSAHGPCPRIRLKKSGSLSRPPRSERIVAITLAARS